MLQYSFSLRNDKTRGYLYLSWFILVIQCAALLFLAINDDTFQRYYYVMGLIVVVTLMGYPLARKMVFRSKFTYAFAAICITWFMVTQYWFALATFVLLVLQYISNQKLALLFYNDRVVAPGILEKTISWSSFSNVILKDGLLTLDYKNNRISQYMVEDSNELPDERDFNEFCRQQLAGAKSKQA